MEEGTRAYTGVKLIMPHYSTATRQGSQYAGFSWTNDQQALIFVPWMSYDESSLPTVNEDDVDFADPEFELSQSNIYDMVRNHYYDSEGLDSVRGDVGPDDSRLDRYRYLTVQVYYAGSWQKFGETHRVEFESMGGDDVAIRGDKLFANPDVLFGSDEMLPIYIAPRKAHIRICLGKQPDGSDASAYGYYVASDIYTYYNLYNAVALMERDGYGSDYDLANSLNIRITAYDENHLFLDQDKGDSNVQAHTHAMDPVKAKLSYGKYVDVASVTPDIRSGDLISEANPDKTYIYSQPVTGISYSKLLGLVTTEVYTHQIDSINYYIVDADGQPVFYCTEANKTTFDAADLFLLSSYKDFKLVPGVSRINTNGTMQLKDLVIEHVFKNKADNDKERTVAVKFHNAVALNIAREGAEEMPEVPEVPEEPSMGQRVVTTTDLDQTIIVTPQKKVAVNVDNKTIGLINGKLGVLGSAGNSTDIVKVTNLQSEPVGTGLVSFWGLIDKTNKVNVLGLPVGAFGSNLVSEANTDPEQFISSYYRINGYQIDNGNGTVTQVVHIGDTQWYRRGSGTQPNVTWGKWQKHGINNELANIITELMISWGLEFNKGTKTVSVKRLTNEASADQKLYDDFYASYDNLIYRDANGTYAGHVNMLNSVVYVDSVAGNDDNDGKTPSTPKRTLEFLSTQPARQSSIIYLKYGGEYEITSGVGRSVGYGALRVFSAYGDPVVDAFIQKYKDSPVTKWWGGYGLSTLKKPIVRVQYVKDPDTGTILCTDLSTKLGGTFIFNAIDFDVACPENTIQDAKDEADIVTTFLVNNEDMEFRFCNFRYNKVAGQAKPVAMFKTGQRQCNFRMYNCTVSDDDNPQDDSVGLFRGEAKALFYITDNYDFKATEKPTTGNMSTWLNANPTKRTSSNSPLKMNNLAGTNVWEIGV